MELLQSGLAVEVAGAFGVGLYISAYAALQFGFIRGQGYIYPMLNLFAASFVLVSLMQSFNMASAIIQVAWITLSTIGMARIFLLSRITRFSEDERRFLAEHLPDLPSHLARRLFDRGVWAELEEGTALTHKGQPVERLVYIAKGEAEVRLDTRQLGTVGDGSLIGEITIATGEPATASAVLIQPSRCFTIDAVQLRSLMRKNPQIARSIETLVAQEMRKKIIAMNATPKAEAMAGA